ncbi:hypothetical protein LCGC14_0890270 [marine sediment metagenome]|uniref:Uncharacterized protein n=1 Tax=marine sediment metagenome TaxID=412755 RepID=A0A0F9P4C0_9ZZZZ
MTEESKQTVGQFKAWVEGVEEMQKDDWHPSKDQWKKIRAKIDELIDQPTIATVTRRVEHPTTLPTITMPAVVIPSDSVQIVDTGVDESTPIPTTSALTTETIGTDGKSAVKSKTPDIDTSDKDYSSPFA